MSQVAEPRRRRTGLFGGSFDPIHRGHVVPVQAARRELSLDRVIYLPTGAPPHKPGRVFAPAYHRFAMAALATLDEEGLFVSSHELDPARPSYTVDTVAHFRAALPDDEIVLLVGADSFRDLLAWRRGSELVASTEIGVLARPGWDPDAAGLAPELRAALVRGSARIVANPPVPVSATALRELLARGEVPPPGTLASPVLQYVLKYALYRTPGNAAALS